MTEPIKIKSGATFSLPVLVRLPSGTWAMASEIRQGDDTLVGALTGSLTAFGAPDADGNTHSGLLEASSVQTATWAPGTWRADVRFADASNPPVVIYSDPFAVLVERGTTHG